MDINKIIYDLNKIQLEEKDIKELKEILKNLGDIYIKQSEKLYKLYFESYTKAETIFNILELSKKITILEHTLKDFESRGK